MGWAVLCIAMQCCVFSCRYTWIYICIKMADDDDNDVLMLSAACCELMYINLYWSLIGCSLLVLARSKNTSSIFAGVVQHSAAQLMGERLHWNSLSYQRSPSHSSAVCVCVCLWMPSSCRQVLSTINRRLSLVYHAQRPALYTMQWRWCNVLRELVCGSWDFFLRYRIFDSFWWRCCPMVK